MFFFYFRPANVNMLACQRDLMSQYVVAQMKIIQMNLRYPYVHLTQLHIEFMCTIATDNRRTHEHTVVRPSLAIRKFKFNGKCRTFDLD